jgi:hypothetical protein
MICKAQCQGPLDVVPGPRRRPGATRVKVAGKHRRSASAAMAAKARPPGPPRGRRAPQRGLPLGLGRGPGVILVSTRDKGYDP